MPSHHNVAICELPGAAPADWMPLLDAWNSTAAAYPHDQCIHEMIEAQVARTPERVALRFEGASLTYAQLNAQANQLAHHLRERGVAPDTCVGLCAERSLAMVVGLLGILKAGAAYVPLDVNYPEQRVRYMIADCGFDLLLTHAAVQERAAALIQGDPALTLMVIDAPEVRAALARYPDTNLARPPGLSSRSLAYVIFTSGSTGRPKGVMTEHRALVNRNDWTQKHYPAGGADVFLHLAPFSFDMSVSELTWPLFAGACMVIARPDGHRDPGYVVGLARETGVTYLHFVPSMLALIVAEEGWSSCTSVRRIFCGGEALVADLVKRHYALNDAIVTNIYGPTETTIDVCHWSCPRDAGLDRVAIGTPMQNVQLHVLDEQRQRLAPGATGELYIGGAGLARGYMNRPELTAERFVDNPFSSEPGARLYRTGDLVRYWPDGNLDYVGRIDNQVKVNGIRIELGEIESQLCQHPAVTMAVVLAREDIAGDKLLVAYVTLAPGIGADAAHPVVALPPTAMLRKHLQASLPVFMVPTLYIVLDAFPLTPIGKIDVRSLPIPEATRRRMNARRNA
jgi:amino acid adenylation domain-containing protein